MELLQYMQENDGVAKVRELKDRFTRYQIEKAYKQGKIHRLNQNTYYLPGTNRLLLAARAHHGCVSCVTALDSYGVSVWNPDSEHIHVASPPGDHRVWMDDVVLHRETHGLATDKEIAPVEQAAFRALRCRKTRLERVVIIDSLLHEKILTKADLLSEFQSTGDSNIRQAIRLGDSATRSPAETFARLELIDWGIPVEAGAVISGIGEVDFRLGDLIIEIDGYQYHSSIEQFTKDRQRSRIGSLLGYTTLRFTAVEATRPGFVVKSITDFITERELHPRL